MGIKQEYNLDKPKYNYQDILNFKLLIEEIKNKPLKRDISFFSDVLNGKVKNPIMGQIEPQIAEYLHDNKIIIISDYIGHIHFTATNKTSEFIEKWNLLEKYEYGLRQRDKKLDEELQHN